LPLTALAEDLFLFNLQHVDTRNRIRYQGHDAHHLVAHLHYSINWLHFARYSIRRFPTKILYSQLVCGEIASPVFVMEDPDKERLKLYELYCVAE